MNELDVRMTEFEDSLTQDVGHDDHDGEHEDANDNHGQGPFSGTQESGTSAGAGDAGMLTGKDYPELCQVCRYAIDACYLMINEDGEDNTCHNEEQTELPCDMAYDQRMFCGKHECINKPTKTDVILTDIDDKDWHDYRYQ